VGSVVSSHAIGAIIVSEVRFFRECLAEILGRDVSLRVQGTCATLADALEAAQAARPDIILLDSAFPGGSAVPRHLRSSVPEAQIIAIAVAETSENILAWAEAGIAGYVPNTASLQELISQLKQISRGEQCCSTRIAGALLRHIAAAERPGQPSAPAAAHLTVREVEVLRLVGSGLSNKDISRRLGISLGTTKSHVHTLLRKMGLQRRTEVAALLNNLTNGLALADLQP
jgi:DNA-binding NarL/FixJ family response regulator